MWINCTNIRESATQMQWHCFFADWVFTSRKFCIIMSDVKNLEHNQTIEKLKEMVKQSPIAMFCTDLSEVPFSACPMSTQQVEDDGTMWFISNIISRHTSHIEQDGRVQLVFTNHGSSSYLTIYGTAEVHFNRAKLDEIWTPLAKAWFPEGKEDPDLTLIRVKPSEGYYWDTKSGKMVSFLKMIGSVVTGKTTDGGIQGGLTV